VLVKWPSANDAMSETIQEKGGDRQFYKVNEVVKLAVCAKHLILLHCGNVFFEQIL
jgi:hypothetical protein